MSPERTQPLPSLESFADRFLQTVSRRRPKKPGDPRLLCLVPSALFAEECAHRLLERCGSTAGVAFHTPNSLSRILSEESGTPMFPAVGRAAVQAWMEHRLGAIPADERAHRSKVLEEDLAYIKRFPKARRALVEALLLTRLHGCRSKNDLPDSRGGRLLGLFLEPFAQALEQAGLADPARRLEAGLAQLPGWLAAKEWVSLIAFPAAAQSPEFLAYAECLQGAGGALVKEERAEAFPRILPELHFFSAQGEEVETEEALERIRGLLEKGVRPDRVALSFVQGEPYLRLIEERADRIGLPLRPTKGMAVRLTGRGRAGRNWLRFVLLDAPSELRAKVLLEPLLKGTGNAAAAALDRRARDEGFIGGLEELQSLFTELPQEVEGHAALRKFLRDCLALREDLLAAPRTSARCQLLAEGMRDQILLPTGKEDPLLRTLQSLAQARELLPPDHAPWSLETMAQLFEELLEESSLPLPQTAKEGIRVLPLQRMGVLDFDHIFVLGCLRGSWPRAQRPHPWLSPKDLEFLGARPQEEQERERLHLLLRKARRSLCLSYPGVDLRARPKSPSPWLEELRALKGDTHPLRPVSASPRERLRRREVERMGLSELEAMTLAAFERKDTALRHFGGRVPCVPPRGAEFIAQRDRFRPGEEAGPFDALGLGPSLQEDQPLSVTAFEDLGTCPLRFFFQHILGLRPLPPEPSIDLVSALDRGSAVHRILQKVFETLIAKGLFDEDPLPLEACLDVGLQEMGRLLRAEADRLMSRQFLRFPRLRQEVLALWGKSLEGQLRLDLQDLAATHSRPVDLEKKLQAALVFRKQGEQGPKESRPILLKGKYDRLDQLPSGRFRILDYKTGSSARSISRREVLQGHKTQLYLYQRLFLESDPSRGGSDLLHPLAALRGVGPKFLVQENGPLPEAGLDEDFWEDPLKSQLEDSLATLVELCDRGNFPFEAKSGICSHCDFQKACPRHHSPSQDRMAREPRAAEYQKLQSKRAPRKKASSRRPKL
ncbi:MAG TPA: PD-(D/E)XK nuclease family protein [Planctomycetes bacterium]|nr:PD-(D/E)XK nuclease family protein [Planctomycetota bacterium]